MHEKVHGEALISKDSICAVPVANRRVRGESVHIEKAFISALYLTHKSFATFYNQVKSKVSNYAYGYDIHTVPAVSWQAVCHIGVGFIVVYLTWWAMRRPLCVDEQ